LFETWFRMLFATLNSKSSMRSSQYPYGCCVLLLSLCLDAHVSTLIHVCCSCSCGI
jgi:hypothetical protein